MGHVPKVSTARTPIASSEGPYRPGEVSREIVTARWPADFRVAVVGIGGLSHESAGTAELLAWIAVRPFTTGPSDGLGYAPTRARRTGTGMVARPRLA
jgi:hypothetical protein